MRKSCAKSVTKSSKLTFFTGWGQQFYGQTILWTFGLLWLDLDGRFARILSEIRPNRLRAPELNPFFANRVSGHRFEAIRASRLESLKPYENSLFLRIDSRESIRVNRRDLRCESPAVRPSKSSKKGLLRRVLGRRLVRVSVGTEVLRRVLRRRGVRVCVCVCHRRRLEGVWKAETRPSQSTTLSACILW